MFAQIPIAIPDIAWSVISPELVLFGFGILVLLLDTAGENRLQAAFLAAGALLVAAGLGFFIAGEVLLPGLAVLLAVLQFALVALWRDRPRMLAAILTAIGFIAGFATTVWRWAATSGQAVLVGGAGEGQPVVAAQSALVGMVAEDGVALFTRFIICLSGLLTVPLGYAYMEDRRIHRGEYYPLLLFAATGMTLLASAADLMMVFISIEILSLALYIMTGFAKNDLRSQEAALKYFLLSSFSSAVLLYGVALAYGAAGTTNIAAVGQALTALDTPRGLALASMALLLVGLAFKTAVVPFHMWTPDVYQGAPTPITGFMAAATKAAAFAAFLRVFVGGFAGLSWSWEPVIWVLAVVTMLGGAILAVVQDDVKRILAYSAVAHAGYVLIGLVSTSREGVSGTLFYLLVYAFMSLGSFGVLSLLERQRRKAMSVEDLRGVGRRYPVPAGLFALFLLSLAGIPPTAGFAAKFAIFRAGVQAGEVGLVVVAVISSVIAAFFYIRIIHAMFMDEPSPEAIAADAAAPLSITTGLSAGLATSAAVVIVLGVLPSLLIEVARRAATFAG